MIRGRYCDTLTDSQGQARWRSGWRPNLVVQDCNLLLAALMKRQEGMAGILYWAVGEGEAGWDSALPRPLPADTRLAGEIARQALDTAQIFNLDAAGQPAGTLSNRLEVVAEFNGADIVSSGFQPLREFGLFGGDATQDMNSGLLIDRVVHPRIDLAPGMTLRRRLRLTFGSGAPGSVETGELGRFGALLRVSGIDGVGPQYASALGEQGIVSLGDLGRIDPLRPIGNIPPVKLREFCAKCRMVLNMRIDFFPLALLADRSISSVLERRPEELLEIIDAPGVTRDTVVQLQQELEKLQVALDDAQLQDLTLGDLVNDGWPERPFSLR